MMNLTHTALSVTVTSIALGTADPVLLVTAAIASQLPDVDTSRSAIGRVLFPISHFLEKRYPHRSITHSFVATSAIALLAIPIAFWEQKYWYVLVLQQFLIEQGTVKEKN